MVRNTIAGGRVEGTLTGLGHGLGVGIYALGAGLGVSALVAADPALERGIELAGALYLLWLGVQTLRHAGRGSASGPGPGRSGMRGFSEGFLTAFLNPKIAVFFLALLGSFLPAEAGTPERAGGAVLAMSIDAAWYVFAALMLAGTGAAAWLRRNGIWVDRIFAALLLAIAGSLLLRAF